MPLRIGVKGSFKKTYDRLDFLKNYDPRPLLDRHGKMGVNALRASTPVDTGLTANSWSYRIIKTSQGYTLRWDNSNVVDGTPIIVLLEFGHGTGTGGYVHGRNIVDPAIEPVMKSLGSELKKELAYGT